MSKQESYVDEEEDAGSQSSIESSANSRSKSSKRFIPQSAEVCLAFGKNRKLVAESYYSKKDYTQTLTYTRDAIALFEDSYYKEANLELAIELSNSYIFVAKLLKQLKRPLTEVMASCINALKYNPKSEEAYFMLGCSHVALAEEAYQEKKIFISACERLIAINDFEEVININPANDKAKENILDGYIKLAIIFSFNKSYDSAIHYCKKILLDKKDDIDAKDLLKELYKVVGNNYFKENNYEVAIEYADKILSYDERNNCGLILKARALKEQNKFTEALTEIRKVSGSRLSAASELVVKMVLKDLERKLPPDASNTGSNTPTSAPPPITASNNYAQRRIEERKSTSNQGLNI
jgi:tetratricopeptide (TPR) repeat protein